MNVNNAIMFDDFVNLDDLVKSWVMINVGGDRGSITEIFNYQ